MGFGKPSTSNGSTLMELDNFETHLCTKARSEKSCQDLENGARFICHKNGCQTWKHVRHVNNIEIDEGSIAQDIFSETSSEN